MRPVLSAVNTPKYNLAKYLEKQIKFSLIDTYSVSYHHRLNASIKYQIKKLKMTLLPALILKVYIHKYR